MKRLVTCNHCGKTCIGTQKFIIPAHSDPKEPKVEIWDIRAHRDDRTMLRCPGERGELVS